LKSFNPFLRYFLSQEFGQDQNIDASFGGTPDIVYKEDVEWTTSAILGTWDFASTVQAHDGTTSIDGRLTVVGSIAQLAKGSAFTVANYVGLTGWLYLTRWSAGKELNIYGWDTTADNMVGNSVNLGDYINTGVFSAWQKFAIPLSDMGLVSGTLDAVRVESAGPPAGVHPRFFLDEIQFEETGAIAEYYLRPTKGTWIHVNTLRVSIADEYAGTLPSAGDYPTMPALPYDTLLGEPALTVGVVLQAVKKDRITFSLTLKQMSDFLEFPGTHTVSTNSDGVNTWLAIEGQLPHPITLKYEDGDFMKFTITEDLTGFLRFRTSASGRVEHREETSLKKGH
jgi:hypothetical protein